MHLSDKMTGEKANLASGADDSMALEAQPTNARIQAATSEDRSTPTSENARLESDTSPFQANLHSKWERDDCTKTFPCECGGGAAGLPRLAFAIGQLGFDFGTEARRDSIMQHMDQPANPHDPKQLLAYLGKNPWDTPAIFWTINLGPTPIYVIQGQGAYAKEAYDLLRNFLEEQIKGEIERVSIPGYIEGTARLLSGHVVPVIWPVMRGMYSWNTTKLTEEVCGSTTSEEAQGVLNFFQRVYEELRNIGIMPQERAINYAATNAFQVKEVYKDAIKSGMELDTIEVGPSPFGRPDSDCWDVKLTFFQPERGFGHPRKSYRFTVDVSDVVPVTVGPMRSWFVR